MHAVSITRKDVLACSTSLHLYYIMRQSDKKKKPVRTCSSPCKVKWTRTITPLLDTDIDCETVSAVVVQPQSRSSNPEQALENLNTQAYISFEHSLENPDA